MSDLPPDLYYTVEHEWVRRTAIDRARIGITDFAQSALGDIVFVQLPDLGAELAVGASFGEVESTKSISDLYAPLSGEAAAVNSELDASPQLLNSDPYGAGWLVDITVAGTDGDPTAELLDAAAYQAIVDAS